MRPYQQIALTNRVAVLSCSSELVNGLRALTPGCIEKVRAIKQVSVDCV